MRKLDRDENGILTTKGRVERLELELQIIALAMVLLALVFMVTGCNVFDDHSKWFGMDAGEVHGKDFTPAHINSSLQCTSTSSGQVCVPVTTYVPDAWNLDLYDHNGDHGWTEVSQQSFDRCKVGQWYPDCA